MMMSGPVPVTSTLIRSRTTIRLSAKSLRSAGATAAAGGEAGWAPAMVEAPMSSAAARPGRCGVRGFISIFLNNCARLRAALRSGQADQPPRQVNFAYQSIRDKPT